MPTAEILMFCWACFIWRVELPAKSAVEDSGTREARRRQLPRQLRHLAMEKDMGRRKSFQNWLIELQLLDQARHTAADDPICSGAAVEATGRHKSHRFHIRPLQKSRA